MNENTMFEREFGRQQEGDPQEGVNLWSMVVDRMHGRWKWAISAGLVLGAALAVVGFRLAGVSYTARGLVQVETRLPTLVNETPETEQLADFTAFIGSQAELMKDGRVLGDALKSEQLKAHLAELGEDPMKALSTDLRVGVIRGTTLISIEFTADDRRLAQAAVNAVLESYFSIYGPNSETQHTRTTQQIRSLLTDARRRLADLEQERERLLKSTLYGTLELGTFLGSRVQEIAVLQGELNKLRDLRTRIEEVATNQNRPVQPGDVAPPTETELFESDSTLQSLAKELEVEEYNLGALVSRFADEHPAVRQARSRVENISASVQARRQEARDTWSQRMASSFGYAALGTRIEELSADLAELRTAIDRANVEQARADQITRDSARIAAEIASYESRLSGLQTESEAIRQGRVQIRAMAQLPSSPSRDRRMQYGAAGFLGGLGASLVGFFLLGTVDRRAFASRQLESDRGRLKPLGVVPDMSRLGDTDEERVLLEDCVHRIRNRIEVRRGHSDRGVALKVSSPFQGDGKTSVAAALAWSYAQAGYRTVMVDADFIGRALSFQFGVLSEPGVREAMREPSGVLRWVRPARPNLDLLPAGSDRSVSAGHLQPAAMRELLDRLRDSYEIVVVDSGPMTASVESLPILGAIDGVVLVLRRGRNRNRLVDCINDIKHVGANYLGVILNYATLSDCQRYSSLSRVSAELAGEGAPPAPMPAHPVVSALGARRPNGEIPE